MNSNSDRRKIPDDEVVVRRSTPIRPWARLLLGALSALIASGADAANIVATSQTTISAVNVYPQFGNGDVIVFLANNSLSASCAYGFWLRATDPGASATLAQVLAAYHTGTPVTIYADTSTLWTGSSSSTCLIYMVGSS